MLKNTQIDYGHISDYIISSSTNKKNEKRKNHKIITKNFLRCIQCFD